MWVMQVLSPGGGVVEVSGNEEIQVSGFSGLRDAEKVQSGLFSRLRGFRAASSFSASSAG